MPLSDRLEERRRGETGQTATGDAPTEASYAELADEVARRVGRLPVYRTRSDRARIVHALTEIDRRLHAMLESLDAGRR